MTLSHFENIKYVMEFWSGADLEYAPWWKLVDYRKCKKDAIAHDIPSICAVLN